MANTLPSPPVTRESTPLNQNDTISESDVSRCLDNLLEHYLEVLDEYTVLREQLSKNFATGFVTLANAQRTSNLGPGRRYGQDGYDGRMKAIKRVVIDRVNDEQNSKSMSDVLGSKRIANFNTMRKHQHSVSIFTYDHRLESKAESEEHNHENALHELTNDDIPSANKPNDQSTDVSTGKTVNASKKPKADPAFHDPVSWYGILVPPALKQAQKSFSANVDTVVPKILDTVASLENIESRIQALRNMLDSKQDSSDNDVAILTTRTAQASLVD